MTRTIQQLFDLTGKTALVTGGSRGLGLQLAHALGEAGAKVLLSSRKASDLEEAVAELKAAGIDAPGRERRRLLWYLPKRSSPQEGTRRLFLNTARSAWARPCRRSTESAMSQLQFTAT